MAGVMVKAYSTRKTVTNWTLSSDTEELDSAYTDGMGFFSMSFTHMDNAGASNANQYVVYCPAFRQDSVRYIQPNASNIELLLLPYIFPTLKLSFTVSNLKYPPLKLELPMNYIHFKYTNGDSVVYVPIPFDSTFKFTYSYDDANLNPHSRSASFDPGSIYKDSFSHHVDIDASKF
jgi:hypothetical protein